MYGYFLYAEIIIVFIILCNLYLISNFNSCYANLVITFIAVKVNVTLYARF